MSDFIQTESNENEEGVHAFLNSLHHFAATAKFEEYFALFHPNGQFLGTDGTENWTMQEFKEWSEPFFTDVECAWEYIPVPGKRNVTIQKSSDSNSVNHSLPTYAVFDEVLYCCDLKCHTRGSGTLVYENKKWLLMLYHITFPIPDALNERITTKIIRGKKLLHQKALLQRQEQASNAAAEQLLLELGLEEGEGGALKKNSKSKNKNKNKNKK
jgi:hypothetical protein